MEEKAKSYEKETGVKVILDVVDGKGSQNTQNSQVDRFISLGVDVICVNMVDRSAASYIISRAMEGDIPVVFFNREPVEEDMNRWEKLYYVGKTPKNPRSCRGIFWWRPIKGPCFPGFKRRRKGELCAPWRGETSHQDSLIRTEWSIQTLKDGGVYLWKRSPGGLETGRRARGPRGWRSGSMSIGRNRTRDQQ